MEKEVLNLEIENATLMDSPLCPPEIRELPKFCFVLFCFEELELYCYELFYS